MTKKNTKRRKHDPFLKYIYSIPKNTRTLLQLAQRRTPALRKMLSDVDLATLEPIPGSFNTVGERGEADLAFKAKTQTGGLDAFVGILLEHKSVKENDVLSQIYHYVFEVMVNKNVKSDSAWTWLPTKAIIIYNGKTDWDPIADFKKKGYKTHSACERDEISISLIKKGKPSSLLCVSFSIRKDKAEAMINEGGKNWTCGVVAEGNIERLYLIPDEFGYSLFSNDHGHRYYMKVPTDSASEFEKFTGKHKVLYDDYNKAWYVSERE